MKTYQVVIGSEFGKQKEIFWIERKSKEPMSKVVDHAMREAEKQDWIVYDIKRID